MSCKDASAIREAKLYVQGLHPENLLTKIVVATPPWEPSDDHAAAVLLSPKLSAYEGNIPKNVLFSILHQYCFDIPVGIEHNPANWAKVKKAIEFAFTQLRSKSPPALKLNAKDKNRAPNSQHKNIFALTQIMVENTQCEVNVLLCARVAVMRKNFIKDQCPGFWDTAMTSSRAFRHILKKDRSLYGVDNYQIDDTIDALQQDVDNIIEAATITTVTSDNDVEGGEDEKHSQNNNEYEWRARRERRTGLKSNWNCCALPLLCRFLILVVRL
ncbi:hypothetical protein C8F04DRAFT_1265262 [Mycena alexandri]|uniref:Uncharacterized protein n=1 Tax=Mycena alexandri TaxID=1745969 RepID=A0AAD6WXQ8_9AGAR|nr:hypothetical protein C8F04DRAFT_1265262 [Mycena alexandri]